MVERAHGVRKIRETDYMIKAGALGLRPARPLVTIRFNGNAHVLPRLAGPQRP